MKKSVLFVLLAGVAAAAGVICLKSFTVSEVPPESLLPGNTCVAVEVSGLKENLDEFRQSRLAKAVSGIDFPAVMKDLEMPREDIESFQSAIDEVTSFLDSTMFGSLFGKNILMAFLPLTGEEIRDMAGMRVPEVKQLLFSKCVMILEPEHNIRFVEALRSFSSHLSGIEAEVVETYNDHAIQKVMLQGALESYNATVGNHLVVTLDRNTLIKTIDLASATEGRLADNAMYRKISGEFDPKASLSIFVNLEEVFLRLSDVVETGGDNRLSEELSDVLDHLAGMQAMGVASYRDDEANNRSKSIVYFDRSKADAVNAKVLQTAPEESRPLKLAPEKTMVYYWTNTLDLKSIIESVLPKEVDFAGVSGIMEMQTGISLESAIAAIGNEFGIILTDINTRGMFPVANLALLLEVNEKETFENLVNSLLPVAEAAGNISMQFEEEAFNGTVLNSLPLPYGTDIRPTYAYYDRYFIAGVNTALVKEMIGGFTSDANLTKSPVFVSADKGLTEKNNVVAFVDSAKLFDNLRNVVAWGNGFAAFARPDISKNAGIISEKIVYPTLEGLKMYEAYGARSYILEDRAIGESYTKINNTL